MQEESPESRAMAEPRVNHSEAPLPVTVGTELQPETSSLEENTEARVVAGPRLLTQPEAPPSAAEGSTSWFEKQFRSQNAALLENFLTDLEAKKRGVTEEKYRIGEVMAELIGPAEHRNRELVTNQVSYERIWLEEKTAAVTLAYEERADRLRNWSLKAQAAQRR